MMINIIYSKLDICIMKCQIPPFNTCFSATVLNGGIHDFEYINLNKHQVDE